MLRAPTLHSLRRSRFLALLTALVILILVSPFLDNSRLHRAYLVILFALIMLAAARMASTRHLHGIIALALGIPWIALSLWGLWTVGDDFEVFADLFFMLFSGFVFVIVLGKVVGAEEVDFDTLLGAVSVYLLIALIWTASYMIIHQLDPGAFHLIHGETRPFFHQFLYFSLTTLTTLGYGDITPLSPFAQTWATMEAVVGTFYMAVLVARLVGMYQSRRPPRR